MDNERDSVTSIFGSNVFNEATMRERLPKDVYKRIKATIDYGEPLDHSIAGVVANAMKDWAIEKGVTHFCHWFQPMTGVTAEKHDSFISPTGDGRTLMEFSAKELIQGEPDASSFPSGGLRATFEARGYTAWDCTSPVFVKDDGAAVTLYIPSVFCSYTSEALDKKTPLLRSMDALNKQALRVLRSLGNTTTRRVVSTLGAEQEYFLIDAEFIRKRMDVVLTGRTLFGSSSPKGQEMEDHYFGAIHPRIAAFMDELNTELWKLGVTAKTQHNEVAPAQYEMAPVFATVNVATDHNQLTMECMQNVAMRHGFACLLHEKPFAGVNGSGKHNNWSLSTDEGANLLDPGKTPHENMQFLVFLCSVIKAVDEYAEILRASAASAGNDHRLGANEAPPAIVSIFLGDLISDMLDRLCGGSGSGAVKEGGDLQLGVSTLPPIPSDATDRNRTSPFAFTGNKFEFRMVGSSQSTAGPCFVLNTIVADVLADIADQLEEADDVTAKVQDVLKKIVTEHRKIIFNGDNYTDEWVVEAEKRGLPNAHNTIDALDCMGSDKVKALFSKHGVLTAEELHARHEILLERYSKEINIEALTTIDIANRQILPAVLAYSGKLLDSIAKAKESGVTAPAHAKAYEEVSALAAELQTAIGKLECAVEKAESPDSYRDSVIPAMNAVRTAADKLETRVGASDWPLPTYAEMLFIR